MNSLIRKFNPNKGTQNVLIIVFSLLITLLTGKLSYAQTTTIFSENFGTPTGTTSLVNYSSGTAPATFQNKGTLTYSNGSQTNSCDIRATSVSSTYSGASGGGNTFFTTSSGAYGLSIESINASSQSGLTLQFGYRKESASLHATFAVDYWNGSAWISVANTSSTLFNETTTAAIGWYISKTLSLPAGAQISGLKIRFVKTGSASIRLDDIVLKSTVNNSPQLTVGTLNEFVTSTINTPSIEQILTVSGSNLTNDISIVPPAGYEISIFSGASFNSANPILLSPVSGTVSSTNIYVRYNPSSLSVQPQIAGSQIQVSSNGATQQNLSVYGNITNLAIGDIALLGFNTSTTDAISFVALNTIPANTIIKFTDNGYSSASDQMSTEGTLIYTATSTINPGTVISWTSGMSIVGTGWNSAAPTNFALNTTGEQIFIYQGNWGIASGTTSLLQGAMTGGNWTSSGSVTSVVANSYLPSTLTSASNAFNITLANAYYTNNVSNITGTVSELFSKINNSSNWTGSASQIVVVPAWSFNFLPSEPTSQASFNAANSVSSNHITLKYNAGSGTSYLIVMRENSAVTAVPVDGTNYASVSGLVDFTTATELSIGQKIVYNGLISSDTVRVEGLSSGMRYHFAIYTYNGTSNNTNFKTVNPGIGDTVTTGLSNSSSSDIIIDGSFSEPENIAYLNYQENSNLNLSNSIELSRFNLRDGGNTIDADNQGTTLTNLGFSLSNFSNLNRLALYSNGVELGEVAIVSSTVSFSGINLTANDNDSVLFSIRVSFKSTVTDNQQLQFAVNIATASSLGSTFSSADAGAAMSGISGNKNKIAVSASKLTIGQEPTTTFLYSEISPAVLIYAKDSLDNLDTDFSGMVSMSSNGTLALTSINNVTAASGIASFSNIIHSLIKDSVVLSFTTSGGINSINADSFNVVQNLPINIFSEHFGTPSGTSALANYITGTSPATFQNKGILTFSSGSQVNACDFRVTNPSSTYTGFSANGNAFFAATSGVYGLSIESINVSNYKNLTLQFGYRKESGTAHAGLSVDYWNGSAWVTLANTSSTLFNETTTAATGWYLSKTLSLPVGAQISGLKIRFIKSGTASIRIDDVLLKGIVSYDPSINVNSLNTFVSPAVNNSSSEQSLVVSGNYLVDNISIVPSAGYEISSASGASFVPINPLILNHTGGVVNSTAVYVRYKPNALSVISGSIDLSSTGATANTVSLLGEITNLSAGSISLIGFDATGNDRFSFVANANIPEGTRLKFTDKSWDSSLVTPAFTSTESFGTWTAPIGGLPKGTVVTMITDPTSSVNLGTGTLTSGLSSVGEQIFAFQGIESNPYFITGFTTGSIINAGTPISSQTYVPAGLSLGSNFFMAGSGLSGSAFLTNAIQTATSSQMVLNIHDTLNWTFSPTFATFPSWLFNFIEQEPDTAPSFLTTTNISNNKMTLHFTGGNGSSYLVAVTTTAPVTGMPADASTYIANSAFGSGSILNANEYVVYNGPITTDSIEVTNLNPGTTYFFSIFAYNGSLNSSNYLTSVSGTGNETTTGIAFSNISDIVAHQTFVEPSLIDYYNYQEVSDLNVSNSIELAMFTARDGGVSGDGDFSSTVLNSITFNVQNNSSLRRLALYSGSTELAEIAVSGSTATFSGLNFSISDDASEDLSLRTSFVSNQSDQTQISFTISSTGTSVFGSSFSSLNAGGAVSSTASNRNKIEVSAIKLVFNQIPVNAVTGSLLSPAPILAAVDTFNNVDIDFISTVDVSSNGTFSGASTLSVNAVNGLATFNNLLFSSPDTSIILTATSVGIRSIDGTKFDVTYNAQPGDVYISEISYESTTEWIELYNKTNFPINIGGWYITDHSAYPASGEGDCLVPSGTIIQANSAVVISTSGTGVNADSLTDISGELLSVAGPRGANNRPTLSNTGDNLALFTSSSSGTLMDGSLSVNYPDNSNSSTISIHRIGNMNWSAAAFGKSTTVFASSLFTNASPGTFGSVLLPGATVISSPITIPSTQTIDIGTNTLTINARVNGNLNLKGSANSNLVLNDSAINVYMSQSVAGTSNQIKNLTVIAELNLRNNMLCSGILTLNSGKLKLNGNQLDYSGNSMVYSSGELDANSNSSELKFSNASSISIPAGMVSNPLFNLRISGAGSVTLGNLITVSNSLILNGGNIIGSSNNTIQITNSNSNSISRTTGFIKAPLIRTLPANLSTSNTYNFPIGGAFYTPIVLNNTQTNSGGEVNILAYVADSASNGTNGTGLSSISSSRYFYLDLFSGNANFISTQIGITDTSAGLFNALGLASSLTGTFNKVSSTAPVSSVFNSSTLNTLGYFVTGSEASGSVNIDVHMYLEGLYLGAGKMTAAPYNFDFVTPDNIADTIKIQLNNAITFDSVYAWIGVLDTSGMAYSSFPSSILGDSFYVSVSHRNSLQTWSATPITIGISNTYDFTDAASKAYGDNMIDLGSGVYGIYSGDINQDGSIDFLDYPDLDLSSLNGDLGYLVTDLNGDASVDFLDYPSIDVNSLNGIVIMRP
jgi:hypothetical protein